MNKIVILLLSVLILTTLNQGIVDFEYTQFAQSAHNGIHHQVNLDFSPIQLKQENLKFPSACHLIDQLKDQVKQKQNLIIEADIDEYLQNIKQKFLDLLTITQKLTNSQTKILHFQGLINKTNPVAPNQQKIFQLEDYQRSLNNLTNFIRQKQQQLKSNFSQMKSYNENTQQYQSQRVELNFNIDLLKQKINYLKDLQKKIRVILSNRQPQTDYNNYFDQLEKEFNNQTLLIANIDSIIRKKDDLAKLKKQKANLQSSITALDLYINDVGLCYEEKQKIRKQFKNHQKINQLISELRQLKQNQQPNIYCQGVVKKLTEKIKTMLRYYDIVASCASDLPEKMNSLKKQKEDLAEITQKINQLQSMQNFEQFQRTYNSQRDKIQTMYIKIKDWKIKQFTHNPDQIALIKQKAQEELNILLLRKSQSKSNYNEYPNSNRISMTLFNLINELKNAKAEYCSLYQKYDSLANSLWTDAHQYQAQMSLKNKLLKLQYEQRLKYEQLNKQLIELRALIYQKLNK